MSNQKHAQIPDTKQIALLRHETLKAVRTFFSQCGYIEIDPPALIRANAVEAQIDPLSTQVERISPARSDKLFLMTSPEIHMKRLLGHGLTHIYSLGHVFRNLEYSPVHRPEFTMLEWYAVGSSLTHIVLECERLFECLSIAIRESPITDQAFPGLIPKVLLPFDSVSMAQAWDQFAKIDLLKCLLQIKQGNSLALVQAVEHKGESLRENADFDDAFTHIMTKYIEPNIGRERPCVLFDWPAQTAALARLSTQNPLIAERFEIYWRGLELANAFAELTDSQTQRDRFMEANDLRRDQNRETLPISENFLRDLESVPPVCGIAVGIDRLMCLLSGASDLSAVLCFDHEDQAETLPSA